MRSVRRTLASSAVAALAPSRPGRSAGSSRRASSGSDEVVAEERLAGRDREHVRPEPVEHGSSDARLASEIASTATIAAMPIAIPTAVSVERSDARAIPRPAMRATSSGPGPPAAWQARVRRGAQPLGGSCRRLGRSRRVRDDPAVVELHPPGQRRREVAVVGDDGDRRAVGGVEVPEQVDRARRRSPESRFPVGSSARTMAGRPTSARATATRCRSPPESCPGRCRARCAEADPFERRLGGVSPFVPDTPR